MRSFVILFCAILALIVSPALSARKSGGDGASSKLAGFIARTKASPNNLIQLKDAQDFASLTGVPRDYSVSALLTAVDSGVPCQPCLNFQPNYEAVARSWRKVKGGEKRHVFSQIEFKDGREIFQQVREDAGPLLFSFLLKKGL